MKLPKFGRKKLSLLIIPIVIVGSIAGVTLANMQSAVEQVQTHANTTTSEEPEQAVEETAVVIEPVEQTVAPAPVPAPAPAPAPAPEETTESYLASQGWNDVIRFCVDVIRKEKPTYFADLATTKRTVEALKVFVSPCTLVESGSLRIHPQYWSVVERKFNQQTAQ